MTFDLTSTKFSTLFRSALAPLLNQTDGDQNRQSKFEPTSAQTLRALSQMNVQQRYDAYWNISCDPPGQKKVKMELAERYFIYDDPCQGMALLNYVAWRNGWKNIINKPDDYRIVGILHDRNPENERGHVFPPGQVFALELSDRQGNVLFSRNYVPSHQNNDTDSWHFNILEQIRRTMPVSGLEMKNYLHLAAMTATSYNSTTPRIENGYVDSPCRNLFLVKKESDVHDVAWRIIDPEAVAVANRSVWLTQAAEKKSFGYRQAATHLANEIMLMTGKKSQSTGHTEAVLALLSRRINDGRGKWLNDFKGFLNHWLERKTKINDVLNSTVTATYYESIKAKYPTLRGAALSTASAINPIAGSLLDSLTYDEKTSVQSFWRFLQQRKDFFEPREIRLDGVPFMCFRSGAKLTFEDHFQQVRFAIPEASNSSLIRECVNHPAVLRSAWESYIDALFADDRYLSAYLNVMDLSLAATLDRVINGQFPQYHTLNTTQRQAYAQQAEAIRLGKSGALLLQHNGEEKTLADRLILIGGDRPHDYLACSVSLGNKVFHTISLTPDGNNLRVHDDTVDFLQDFFPGNSLMKTQRLAVPTPERARPVEVTIREGFTLVENSNPVVALVEAHKYARKRVAKQLANSAEETAELNKVRFYDRLAEIATDVALIIPLSEPLALEALAVEGVTKTIVEEGLQVTGKVINAASLALPVVAQWQPAKQCGE